MCAVKRISLKDRLLPDYTSGEELFHMISHIVGVLFGITAFFILTWRAMWRHDLWAFGTGLVYRIMMTLLYTMSSVYHGLRPGMAKKVFQVLDHCSVFLLIAGTYTPLLLNGLRAGRPGLAWSTFGAIWGVALIGITLTAIDLKAFRIFSMVCYLGLGWAAVFVWGPMAKAYAAVVMRLLLAGGVAYTVGAICYIIGKKRSVRYMHGVFHIFCLIGSVLHFISILSLG